MPVNQMEWPPRKQAYQQLGWLGRWWSQRAVVARFGALTLLILASSLLTSQLMNYSGLIHFGLFYIIIALAAAVGGGIAGTYALAASAVASFVILDGPIGRVDLFRVALFVLACLPVILIVSKLQRAQIAGVTHSERMSFLESASELLSERLDNDQLEELAALAVRGHVDWCIIHLVDHGGRLVRIARASADAADLPAMDCWIAAIDRAPRERHLMETVIEQGTPLHFPHLTEVELSRHLLPGDIDEVLGRPCPASLVVTPMIARDTVLGTLTLGTTDNRVLVGEDLAVATVLARRCATALDNTRLFRSVVEAEHNSRLLFEGADDALVVTNDMGFVDDVNPAAERLLQRNHHDIVGRRISSFFGDSGDGGQVPHPSLGFTRWAGEVDLKISDHVAVPAEVRSNRIVQSSGPRVMFAIRDISERRAVERLQQDFLAMVSHDLKTPITAIRGHAQLMARQDIDLPSIRTIIEQTVRMEHLIDDLLDVARIESGHLELHPVDCDIVRIAHAVVEAITPVAQSTHKLLVRAPNGRITGPWDGARISQVIENLVINAVKYSAKGGDVTVELQQSAEMVIVRVRDQGPGISLADQQVLFNRFSRVGHERSAHPVGLGLGLYISRMIVEAHGGVIGVTSRPGDGSSFWFSLPFDPSHHQAGNLVAAHQSDQSPSMVQDRIG